MATVFNCSILLKSWWLVTVHLHGEMWGRKPNLTKSMTHFLRWDHRMLLHKAPTRTLLRLTSVDLPKKNCLRMQELGIRPGTEAVVTQHAGFGGLVLNIAGSRVAVDHRSARKIEAEVVA